jgi:hypothetical protein
MRYKIVATMMLALVVMAAIYTLPNENVILTVDNTNYSIPSQFIPKTNKSEKPDISGFDNVGMELSLIFSNELLFNLYSDYKLLQGEYNSPTSLSVSVYDAKNINIDNRMPYNDVLLLTGEFTDAKVVRDYSTGYYKISRKGDDLGQWFYILSEPNNSPKENNKIIAVCHGVLPSKGISSCSASIKFDELFLNLRFSHINIELVEQFTDFVKQKFVEWKE